MNAFQSMFLLKLMFLLMHMEGTYTDIGHTEVLVRMNQL